MCGLRILYVLYMSGRGQGAVPAVGKGAALCRAMADRMIVEMYEVWSRRRMYEVATVCERTRSIPVAAEKFPPAPLSLSP